MPYNALANRYDDMQYNRCGNTGLLLPAISLGLWHNFGDVDVYENSRAMLRRAFDTGITHFDLANNYGPPYGSAESTFGKILKKGYIFSMFYTQIHPNAGDVNGAGHVGF